MAQSFAIKKHHLSFNLKVHHHSLQLIIRHYSEPFLIFTTSPKDIFNIILSYTPGFWKLCLQAFPFKILHYFLLPQV